MTKVVFILFIYGLNELRSIFKKSVSFRVETMGTIIYDLNKRLPNIRVLYVPIYLLAKGVSKISSRA